MQTEGQRILNMRNQDTKRMKTASIKEMKMENIKRNRGKIILLSILRSPTETIGQNNSIRTQAAPT